MARRWTITCLSFAFLLAFGATMGFAAPIWPDGDAAWTPLPDPCGQDPFYVDPHGDFPGAQNGHHDLDIVGSVALNLPSVFAATDGTNLMFRMRLDKLAALTPDSVWQFLFDFAPTGTVDWSLQLDNKTDNDIELVSALTGAPLFHQVHLSTTNAYSDDLPTSNMRIVDPTLPDLGDSGPGDSFLDISIPWVAFTGATGQAAWNGTGPFPWLIYATTSDSHNQVNKDTPECIGPSADQAPEPATMSLLALGGAALLARRRRRA